MGKHFALTLQLEALTAPKARQKSRSSQGFAIPAGRKYGVFILGACCLLAVAYLYQVNSFSTKGFEIVTLQNQIATLQDQQKQLAVSSAALQSLQRIQSDPEVAAMVPVTSVNYIQNGALTIAH